MGFSRQEYWSGLSFSSPGDLPDPGIKPRSPAFQADTLTSEPPGKPVILVLPPSPAIKSVTASIVSPSICHEVMGTGCHDLHFLNVEL